MENLSGRTLGGFLLGERLALGGMAAVYRARQLSTEREVAVKVLPQSAAGDAGLNARFEREARLLASLQHPHILPLIDFGRDGAYSYFVTPLIPHGDLADQLARWGGPLPLAEIRRIALQLCDALDAAHQAGIVHRDLKPANVLIDARGNCLLSDFGIAKVEGGAALTSTGVALGTPEYMSPEQGMGQAVDARSDIYALGVILYQLATYRVPFQADAPTALLLKHQREAPPAPRSLNAALPEALEQVILKALAKAPADRYESAAALGRAVAQALPARSDASAATRVHRAPERADADAATVVMARAEAEPRARTGARVRAVLIAVLAVVVALLLGLAMWLRAAR